jgi:nicotinamidase-related amidase
MQNTALLVIDIQRAAFDGVRCPPMDSPEALVQSATALIAAAHAGGRPVVFIQHSEGAGEPFEVGTPHWELHEALMPGPGDLLVEKRQSSSFEGTDLHARLKAKGIDSLVLCGLQSEHCVSNTTRSALQLGYRVTLAQDGHGTWPWDGRSASEIRAEVNTRLAEAGAKLQYTAQLAEGLRQA